jgi:hypothetical protein
MHSFVYLKVLLLSFIILLSVDIHYNERMCFHFLEQDLFGHIGE